MKKLILISLLTLGFISLSFAGGDDRDQELPLNSLNTALDDDSLLPESNQNQNKQASETNTADLEQLLKEIEEDLNESTDLDQKLEDKIRAIFKFSKKTILIHIQGASYCLEFSSFYCFLCLSLICFFQGSDLPVNNNTK